MANKVIVIIRVSFTPSEPPCCRVRARNYLAGPSVLLIDRVNGELFCTCGE